ncbi:MAG: S-layer homology domain-containing protein [Candidatus Margulisbacteria bacterium]|nr:S-layer homology domain-containing protein [Candidatus Margulisiibacteriota bacterium]
MKVNKLLLVLVLSVCLAGLVFAQAALDPSRLAIGGRGLGLGRTYVGLADDVSSIFLNPAGLARIPRWQMTSMAGQFAEEYSYLLLTGAYPTEYGVFGAGFVGASTGGVPVTKVLEGTESDPVYVIDPTQPAVDYFNNVYFLSLAREVPKIWNYDIPWNLRAGASLKLFNTSLTGDSIINGSGFGTELDVGLLADPLPYLALGFYGRNVLPYSMGGKLTYASDYSEHYPAAFILGGSMKVLGPKDNAFRKFMNHELTLLLDTEFSNGVPMLMHMGAEWKPHPIIALRMGIDQDVSSDMAGNLTTENGMAYGVGLTYGGFRFDYAFHEFPGLPGINNSYFSLSYGIAEAEEEITEKISIFTPADKLVTFESSVVVQGRVNDMKIKELYVNGIRVKFGLKGDFKTSVSLKTGKNNIRISGKDGNKLITVEQVRALRLITFPDVEQDYWVAQPISLLAMQEIITGYPDGTFRAEGDINRAEMCALLIRTKGQVDTYATLEATTEAELAALIGKEEPLFPIFFTDVSEKFWASSFIKDAADLEIVKGYPDGTFRPNNKITRAEGLAMITRLADVSEEAYAYQFPDVTESYWAAPIISGAYNQGMLEFLRNKRFQPMRSLTRAETVELLQRTKYVEDLLGKDLLDWESY